MSHTATGRRVTGPVPRASGFLAAILLFVTGLASAQTARPDPVALTVAEARRMALERNPSVLAARAAIDAASAREREARAVRLPGFALSARYARLSDIPDPSVTVLLPAGSQTIRIAETVLDQYRLGATASVPLYTGGRLENAERAAEHLADAAENDLAAARDELAYAIDRAYWNLASARAAARTVGETVRAIEARLADIRRYREAGVATNEDVLAAEVRLSEARLRLMQTEHAAETLESSLASALSLPLDTHIGLADSASMGSGPVTPPPLADLRDAALFRRSELAAFADRRAAAERRIAVERGARMPNVAVQADYDFSNPNMRYFPIRADWHGTWSAAVGASWTAWDWGAAASRRSAAEAELRGLEERERQLRDGIALEVQQARAAYVEALRRIELATVTIVQATEHVRAARDRHAAETVSATDVLDAEVESERAGLALIQAYGDARIAESRLARAVGSELR